MLLNVKSEKPYVTVTGAPTFDIVAAAAICVVPPATTVCNPVNEAGHAEPVVKNVYVCTIDNVCGDPERKDSEAESP
jgi:hypothetical protein